MSVDRLSVTVPAELGAALRSLAKSRGTTVSTIVTEAVEREVRFAALDVAMAEADRRFGPVPESMIRAAEEELLRTARNARSKRRVARR